MNMEELADQLDIMQSEKNEGRGVSCIKTIVTCLRATPYKGTAKIVAWNENDKIRQYPDLWNLLNDNLFGPDEDSPKKLSERIRNLDV